ncbi:hypothetical protein EC988_004378 [Linderina pennispora]|nr:hypothetical protein EC988_004378 [Linderina pennispora]
MGTFGALVAQHLYTNSATGWYIHLNWTFVYSYIVTIFSTIIAFFLMLGALVRGTPHAGKYCTCLFHSAGLFLFGFIFSVLWIVIVSFAYRNPLPIHYPCDIFRHLRANLTMLGLSSGKSVIEEGGLLVGICQASKAFLVLAGIGLAFWILIFVLSCVAMTVGLDNPQAKPAEGSRRSLRSVITGRTRRTVQPPVAVPVPPTEIVHDGYRGDAVRPRSIRAPTPPPARPRPARPPSAAQACKHCHESIHDSPSRSRPVAQEPRTTEVPARSAGLANPNDAFYDQGYESPHRSPNDRRFRRTIEEDATGDEAEDERFEDHHVESQHSHSHSHSPHSQTRRERLRQLFSP